MWFISYQIVYQIPFPVFLTFFVCDSLLSHFPIIAFLQLGSCICNKYLSCFFSLVDKFPKYITLKLKSCFELIIDLILFITSTQKRKNMKMTSRHWARSGLSLCDFLILGVIKNLKIKVNSLHRSEVEVSDCVLHMFKQTFIYIEEYPIVFILLSM